MKTEKKPGYRIVIIINLVEEVRRGYKTLTEQMNKFLKFNQIIHRAESLEKGCFF